MSRRSRADWLRLFGSLLAVALLVFLLSRQGWRELAEAAGRIPPWRLLTVAGLIGVSRVATAARWHVLLRASGARVSPGQCLRLTFAGLFAGNFLPTTVGGDAARLAGAVQLGLGGSAGAASLVLDRLVGMLGMAAVLPFGLTALARVGTLAAALSAVSSPPLRPAAWREKAGLLARRLLGALGQGIRRPRALLAALACTGVHMLCLFLSIALLLAGMGERLPLHLIAGLWALVYFVTLLPISINGLGAQELSVSVAFSHLGGVSLPACAVLALLIRAAFLLASLPGALFLPAIVSARGDNGKISQDRQDR